MGRRLWVVLAVLTAAVVTGCGASGSDAPSHARFRPEPGSAAASPRTETQDIRLGNRAVAYSATLTVRAAKVGEAAARAKQIVTAAGGYVASENSTTGPARTRLTVQVPAAEYPAVLSRLARDLGEQLALEQSADDVTEQVADVDSRVKSAQAALDRLRALMTEARSVSEVLQVSAELDKREADLESLQSRQRALSQKTTYATVTLTIHGPAAATADDDDPAGFLGGLAAGWDAFATAVMWFLTILGWSLPFLALPALAACGYALRARRRRARADTRP